MLETRTRVTEAEMFQIAKVIRQLAGYALLGELVKVPKEESKLVTNQALTPAEILKGRSSTYHSMSPGEQWAEDKRLGILDWDGK